MKVLHHNWLKNYCWWFRNPANQLRLVVSPLFTGFYTSQVVQDFFHQQYVLQCHHHFIGWSYHRMIKKLFILLFSIAFHINQPHDYPKVHSYNFWDFDFGTWNLDFFPKSISILLHSKRWFIKFSMWNKRFVSLWLTHGVNSSFFSQILHMDHPRTKVHILCVVLALSYWLDMTCELSLSTQ